MFDFSKFEQELKKFKGVIGVNFIGVKNGYIIFEDFCFQKNAQDIGYYFGEDDPEVCKWFMCKNDISNIIINCDDFSNQIVIEFHNNEKLVFEETG